MKNNKWKVLVGSLVLMSSSLAVAEDYGAVEGGGVTAKRSYYGVGYKRMVKLTLGPNFGSDNLAGNGFGSSLATTRGVVFGMQFNYNPTGSQFTYRAKYRSNSIDYSGIPGVTPNAVSLSQKEYRVSAHMYPFTAGGFMEKLQFGLGYSILKDSVGQTMPNSVATDKSMNGPTVIISHSGLLTKDFNYDADVTMDFIMGFKENYTPTGALSSAFQLEPQFMLVYTVSDRVDLAGGMFYRYRRFGYSGVGSRGTSDASENINTLGIPFELRVKF